MNQVISVVVALAIMAGIYMFGYSEGKSDANAKATQAELALRNQREELQKKLDASDVALLEAKKERDSARAKEVIKYVTVYRDKIKDPVVADCVNHSGLLELYNSTLGLPAAGK